MRRFGGGFVGMNRGARGRESVSGWDDVGRHTGGWRNGDRNRG